jgi:hypothetical protein
MRSPPANARAHDRQRSGQCSTIASTCSGGSSRRYRPSCPCCPPRFRPDPSPRGRRGADGGSCEGGSDEFRELRFRRRSSSATRASSRSFASTRRWFASTSSSSRSNNPTAVSRSPSRIASASARSTQNRSPPGRGSLLHLNAYMLCCLTCRRSVRRGYRAGTHFGTGGHSRASATSGVALRHASSSDEAARSRKSPCIRAIAVALLGKTRTLSLQGGVTSAVAGRRWRPIQERVWPHRLDGHEGRPSEIESDHTGFETGFVSDKMRLVW